MSLTSGLDMKFGHDLRGDYALFIDKKRLKNDCFDEETTELLKKIKDATFFRLIDGNQQLRTHGWIENGKIIQWG
jgi:hypothetical protein